MPGEAIVTVRDKQWQVSVATYPWELAQGLGGIPAISAGTGMLFDTGWEQIAQVTTFPMLFSLDICFLSEGLVVLEVYRDVEPGYLVTSEVPARYFLEVNAGELEGVETGDRASVELLPLEEVPAMAPDWMSMMLSFMGFMVMAAFMVGVARSFTRSLVSPEGRLLPQTQRLPAVVPKEGQYSWLITDPVTGEILVKAGYATVSKARRAARDFALRRAKYEGEHPVGLRIYDREPDIGNLEAGVVHNAEMTSVAARVVEWAAAGLFDKELEKAEW